MNTNRQKYCGLCKKEGQKMKATWFYKGVRFNDNGRAIPFKNLCCDAHAEVVFREEGRTAEIEISEQI